MSVRETSLGFFVLELRASTIVDLKVLQVGTSTMASYIRVTLFGLSPKPPKRHNFGEPNVACGDLGGLLPYHG